MLTHRTNFRIAIRNQWHGFFFTHQSFRFPGVSGHWCFGCSFLLPPAQRRRFGCSFLLPLAQRKRQTGGPGFARESLIGVSTSQRLPPSILRKSLRSYCERTLRFFLGRRRRAVCWGPDAEACALRGGRLRRFGEAPGATCCSVGSNPSTVGSTGIVSLVRRSICLSNLFSSAEQNETAAPVAPARPVRPMR